LKYKTCSNNVNVNNNNDKDYKWKVVSFVNIELSKLSIPNNPFFGNPNHVFENNWCCLDKMYVMQSLMNHIKKISPDESSLDENILNNDDDRVDNSENCDIEMEL